MELPDYDEESEMEHSPAYGDGQAVPAPPNGPPPSGIDEPDGPHTPTEDPGPIFEGECDSDDPDFQRLFMRPGGAEREFEGVRERFPDVFHCSGRSCVS